MTWILFYNLNKTCHNRFAEHSDTVQDKVAIHYDILTSIQLIRKYQRSKYYIPKRTKYMLCQPYKPVTNIFIVHYHSLAINPLVNQWLTHLNPWAIGIEIGYKYACIVGKNCWLSSCIEVLRCESKTAVLKLTWCDVCWCSLPTNVDLQRV